MTPSSFASRSCCPAEYFLYNQYAPPQRKMFPEPSNINPAKTFSNDLNIGKMSLIPVLNSSSSIARKIFGENISSIRRSQMNVPTMLSNTMVITLYRKSSSGKGCK